MEHYLPKRQPQLQIEIVDNKDHVDRDSVLKTKEINRIYWQHLLEEMV